MSPMNKQFWAKLLVLAMVLTMLPVAALGVGENAWSETTPGVYTLQADANGAYVLNADTTLAGGTYVVDLDADGVLTVYNVTLDANAVLTINKGTVVKGDGQDGIQLTVTGGKLELKAKTVSDVVYLVGADSKNVTFEKTTVFEGGVYQTGKDTAIIAPGKTGADVKWPGGTTPPPGGNTGSNSRPTGGNSGGSTPPATSDTTTLNTDAGKGVTTVPAEGVTTAEVTLKSDAVNKAIADNAPVALPVPALTPTDSSETAPVVTITVPASVADKSYKVAVPVVETAGAGVVPVLVLEDGTEEVIRVSTVGENGVVFNVTGNAKVKLVDNAKAFEDVAEDHWAAGSISFTSAREIFRGTSDTAFTPGASMTRSMLVTVLHRLNNEEFLEGDVVMTDVDVESWYADAMAWAIKAGVVNGTGEEGLYAPERNITRSELCTMIYRYAKDLVSAEAGSLEDFTDADAVPDWATDAMAWAVGAGLINGRPVEGGVALDLESAASRAEVAAVLQRLVDSILA